MRKKCKVKNPNNKIQQNRTFNASRYFSMIPGIFFMLTLASVSQAESRTVTILFTGDTYATLDPAELHEGSRGGLARRMAAVDQVRDENPNLLLIDSGGFFAGGIYDESIKGEDLDRERTKLTVRAMAAMGYDAVCVGEEELAFGLTFLKEQAAASGIPFLSSNLVETRTGVPAMKAYEIQEVEGVRVGLIGLTNPEVKVGDYRKQTEGLDVINPIRSASEWVQKLRPDVDILVVLSHLGESESFLVAQEVSGIDILVTGHGKDWRCKSVEVGKTLVVHSVGQGGQIGRLDVLTDERGRIASNRFTTIDLGPGIDEAQGLAAEIEAFWKRTAGKERVRIDLYGMGECPYCPEAEQVVHRVKALLAERLDVRFFYIVDEDENGRLVSMHGAEEVAEDLRQLAIQDLAPERFWDYILKRGGPDVSWQEAAAAAGIDTIAIIECVSSGTPEIELRSHLHRTNRLGIDRSPTLFINNRSYPGRIEHDSLLRALCAQYTPKGRPAVCASIPECASDADCLKPGFIGTCEDAGTPSARCVYRKDVRIGLTLIYDSRSLFSREADALRFLKALLPGTEVRRVEGGSVEGKELISKHGIRLLPAYIFDSRVIDAINYDRISRMFHRSVEYYVFDSKRAGSTVRVHRSFLPGALDIYLSPSSPEACAITLEALDVVEGMKRKPDIAFHYIVREKDGETGTASGFDNEEIARQAVVRAMYPERYLDYFKVRCDEAGSSYWEDGAKRLGIDPERIREAARGELGQKLLREESDLAEGLDLSGEIGFVFNNREVAVLSRKEQLIEAVRKLMEQQSEKSGARGRRPEVREKQ